LYGTVWYGFTFIFPVRRGGAQCGTVLAGFVLERQGKTKNKRLLKNKILVKTMIMTMKIIKYIFEIVTLIIIVLAFFSLIFNWSWRFYPIGFTIGYALSVVIKRLIK